MSDPRPAADPREVARTSVVDSFGQLAVIAVSMAGGIFLSRLLGADGRGAFVLATSVVTGVIADLAALGLGVAAQVFASKHRARVGEVHTLALAGIAASSLVAVLVGLAAGPFLLDTVFKGLPWRFWALQLATLPFLLYLPVGYGILVGLGQVRRRSAFDVVFYALQNVAIVGVLLAGVYWVRVEPVAELVFLFCGMQALGAAALAREVSRHAPLLAKPGRDLARPFYRYGIVVWFGQIPNAVAWRIDQFIVNGMLGTTALGVYNLATSNAQRSTVPALAVTRTLHAPVVAAGTREAAELCALGFRQLLVVGAFTFLAGIAVAPLFPVVFGEDFRGAGELFLVVLAGWVFHNASRCVSLFYSGHLVDPTVPTVVNWVVLPLQGALTWALAARFGLMGAAAATAASYSLVCAGLVAAFLRRADTPTLGGFLRFGPQDRDAWAGLLAPLRARFAKQPRP
ncbi:MAG: lipopolysaccharide biosynthesis protein [Candidatus Sumerlaeia bacterium]|nr:lipopolysaccharide biosynthesis protein [Candidatus Sumerlaeia bacterium]